MKGNWLADHILTTFQTISYSTGDNPCNLNIRPHFFLRVFLIREHRHLLLFEWIYVLNVPAHLLNWLRIQEVKPHVYVVNHEWLYVL